jgi:hypothetical protein
VLLRWRVLVKVSLGQNWSDGNDRFFRKRLDQFFAAQALPQGLQM